MPKLRIILLALIGLVSAVAFALFLLLESRLFAEIRRDLMSEVLTRELGQALIIEGDVRVKIGRQLTFIVEDAHIPSENIADLSLINLDRSTFKMDARKLLDGEVDLLDVTVSGFQVNLIKREDGVTSWTTTEGSWFDSFDDDSAADKPLFGFFRNRKIDLRDVQVSVRFDDTQFEFLFDLKEFNLDYKGRDQPVPLLGFGQLNGQNFEISGHFPRVSTFRLSARFGEQTLKIEGDLLEEEDTDGFEANLEFASPSLAGLTRLFGLKPYFDGVGRISSKVRDVNGRLSLSDIDMIVEPDDETTISVAGSFENIINLDGLDVLVAISLVDDVENVAAANRFQDFKLLSAEARLLSDTGAFRFVDLEAVSNAFETNFDRFGPATADRLVRSSNGLLRVEGIEIISGDPDNPYLTATGEIGDLLGFNAVSFGGRLRGTADMFLENADQSVVDAFGEVTADFRTSNNSGDFAVEQFSVRNSETDLWSIRAELSVADIVGLDDVLLGISLEVDDGGTLLGSVGLTPIDVEELSVNLNLHGSGLRQNMEMYLGVNGREIEVKLNHRENEFKNVLRGSVTSAELNLAELIDLTGSVIELVELRDANGADQGQSESLFHDSRTPLPLVLSPDGREVLPLVLEARDSDKLLLQFLHRLDLEVGVRIDRLTGAKMFSGMDSLIRMNRGRMKAGPFEARMDGASVRFDANVNTLLEPGVVNVAGKITNWKLRNLLDLLGQDFDAFGKLSGSFELSSDIAAAGGLLRSTVGWLRLDMRDGKIGSSLIDLAGMGVLPWLFSKELAQGYSHVTCLVIPANLNRGILSTSELVLETRSVQLVAKGKVNLNDRTLNMRGEPRPLGRPLARSALPFDVSGTFDNPQVDLGRGGKSRENPGKSTRVINPEPCHVYNLK